MCRVAEGGDGSEDVFVSQPLQLYVTVPLPPPALALGFPIPVFTENISAAGFGGSAWPLVCMLGSGACCCSSLEQ